MRLVDDGDYIAKMAAKTSLHIRNLTEHSLRRGRILSAYNHHYCNDGGSNHASFSRTRVSSASTCHFNYELVLTCLRELKDTTLSAQSALAQLSIGGRVDFESQLAMKIEDSRFLESVHNRLEGLTVAARQDGGEMGDIVECTGLQQISDTFPELAYTVSPDSVSGLPSTFTSQTSPSPKNTLETGDVFEDGHPPTYLDYIKGLVASSIAESSESLDARTKYCPASLGNLNRSFVAETGCDFGVDVSQEQTSAVFGTDLVSIGLAEGNSNSLSAAQYVGYRVRAKAEDFAVDGGLEEEEDTGAETKPTQGNVLVSRASLNLGADSASTGGDESNVWLSPAADIGHCTLFC